MQSKGPIKINVSEALRSKLGGMSRFIPSFLVKKLEKTICQDDLNELLRTNYPKVGGEFCRGVLDELDINLVVEDAELLPPPTDRKLVFVSNHPLGGLDGMALIAWLKERYGVEPKFIVNDLLMAVKPLANVFIPINKHGKQSRESLREIDRALSSDVPVAIFPAGLVSRKRKSGLIMDLEWHKMFVSKALEHHRDIVPLYIDAKNSPKFYKMASRRKKLGIKFNIEMIYLPSEVFGQRGKTLTIKCGRPVEWQSLHGGAGAADQAKAIKEMVYAMSGLPYNPEELDG